MTNRRFVSIEGNIGSGKSTFLAHLEAFYRDKNNKDIVFIPEPVDQWSVIRDAMGQTMLEKFYQDQKKYAFSFQIMAYMSRLATLKKAVHNHPEASIFISERCLETDRCVFAKMLFDQGKMEDIDYQIYTTWFDTLSKEFPICIRIYVKADPATCHHRIAIRCRQGEATIPLDYLEMCHEYHERMMLESKAFVVTFDGNMDKTHALHEWTDYVDACLLDNMRV